MEAARNSVSELQKIDIALNIYNTHPNEYCFDNNFNLVKSTDNNNQNNLSIINKISSLFSNIVLEGKVLKISLEKWKLIFSHVQEFANKTNSSEIIKLSEIVLKPMRDRIFCDDYDYQINSLLSQEIGSLSPLDIKKGVEILTKIQVEISTTNKMVLQHIFTSLEHLFDYEFSKNDGSLVPCDRFVGKYRIDYEKIEVKSSQNAAIVMHLQTKLQKGENNELFKYMVNLSENLKPDSRKTLFVWETYLISCFFSKMAEHLVVNDLNVNPFFVACMKQEGDVFSEELKKFHESYRAMTKSPEFMHFFQLPARESVKFCFEQMDIFNDSLQPFIQKKSELDRIYRELHATVQCSLQRQKFSKEAIRECYDFQMLYTPEEFEKTKVYDIRTNTLRKFFREVLLPQRTLYFKNPQDCMIDLLLKTLFSIDETSREFFDIKYKIHKAYAKKLEHNLPYFKNLKTRVNFDLIRLSKIKLQEFKDLLVLEERSRQEILDDDSLQKKMAFLCLDISQAAQTSMATEQENISLFREKIEKLKILIDSGENISGIVSLIFELDQMQHNSITYKINDLFITLTFIEAIESQFEKQEQVQVLFEEQVPSGEKDLKDEYLVHIKQEKIGTSEKKKGKGRRRYNKRIAEINEKEPEKEKEITVAPLITSNSWSPLLHHQLFSIKEIVMASRVSAWFSEKTASSCLLEKSYSKLSPKAKQEQVMFHSYPLCITLISLIWGQKSTWSNEKNPHFSLVGKINRYEKGKEAVYKGVFTDCFSKKNSNLLFHHYFSIRQFNQSIIDSANDTIFQPMEELQIANRMQNLQRQHPTQFIDDSTEMEIIQKPGRVTIDDKKKKIRYTVILSQRG